MTNQSDAMKGSRLKLNPFERKLFFIGTGIIAACVILALFYRQIFFVSYLLGFLFIGGIVFGCFSIYLIHNLSGGSWGIPIKGILEAAIRTLPLIALMFVPVLLGAGDIYAWTSSAVMQANPHLAGKVLYLNIPFFAFRSVLFFSIWLVLARFLVRLSESREKNPGDKLEARIQILSGLGLVAYVLTMTLASYDWLMSLDPEWFSTMFGPMFMIGMALVALSFCVMNAAILAGQRPLGDVLLRSHFHDLGNLMLAFVMLWTYMAFSQYLIIWSGNLPEEIHWYLRRIKNGWVYVGWGLLVFHFAIPFFLLLMRFIKRSARLLALVAALIMAMRFVDLLWHVIPEFEYFPMHMHWMYILLPSGMACVWFAAFRRCLRGRELILSGQKLKEA